MMGTMGTRLECFGWEEAWEVEGRLVLRILRFWMSPAVSLACLLDFSNIGMTGSTLSLFMVFWFILKSADGWMKPLALATSEEL